MAAIGPKLPNLMATSLCDLLLADSHPSGNSVSAQQLCKGLLSVFTKLSGWSGVQVAKLQYGGHQTQ